MRVTIAFLAIYLVAFTTKKAKRRFTSEEYEKKVRVKSPYNVIDCMISCDEELILGAAYMSDTGDKWMCIEVDRVHPVSSKLRIVTGTCEKFYGPTEIFYLCQPVVVGGYSPIRNGI